MRKWIGLIVLLGSIYFWQSQAVCTQIISALPLPSAGPGDVLCLRGGTYLTERLTFSANGTELAPITLRSYPGERAILQASTNDGLLEFSGSYWIVSGLTLDNNLGGGGPALQVRAGYFTLRDSEIRNGNYYGVDLVREAHDILIENNDIGFFYGDFEGDDAHCIGAGYNVDNVVVRGNRLHDCWGDGIQLYYPNGVQTPEADHNRNWLIENNVFERGTLVWSENGVDLKQGMGVIIRNNEFSGYGAVGDGGPALLLHRGIIDVAVENNYIHGGARGINLFGDTGMNPIGARIENNTLQDLIGSSTVGYGLQTVGAISPTIRFNTFINVTRLPLNIVDSPGAIISDNIVTENIPTPTTSPEVCTHILNALPLPAAGPGAVICLRGGVYPTTGINLTANGTFTSPITLRSYPGEQAVLLLSAYSSGAVVTISGSYWMVQDLEIDAGGFVTSAVNFRVESVGSRLVRVVAHHGRYHGIQVRGDQVWLVDSQFYDFDNSVADIDAECIIVHPTADNLVIQGNLIHDCSGNGIEFYHNLSDPTPEIVADNFRVENNTLWRGSIGRAESGIGFKQGAFGIVRDNELSGYSSGAMFGARHFAHDIIWENNYAHDGDAPPIQLYCGPDTYNLTFRNNVFDNLGDGIGDAMVYLCGGQNITIENNTWYDNRFAHGFRFDGGILSGSIRDNLLVGSVISSRSATGVISATVGPNAWYDTPAGVLARPGDLVRAGEPGFVDAENGDFRLRTESEAAGFGAYPEVIVTVTPTPTPTATQTATPTERPLPTSTPYIIICRMTLRDGVPIGLECP